MGSKDSREGCCVRCRMGQHDLGEAKASIASSVMAVDMIATVIVFVDFMMTVFDVCEKKNYYDAVKTKYFVLE